MPAPDHGGLPTIKAMVERVDMDRSVKGMHAHAPTTCTMAASSRVEILNKYIVLAPRALALALTSSLSLASLPSIAQSTTGSIFGQVPVASGETVLVKSS